MTAHKWTQGLARLKDGEVLFSRTKRSGKIAFLLALLLILTFQVWSIVGQSLTSDEPYHLAAGYQALNFGTNTLNLEHPPLVKLIAALPFYLERQPLAPSAQVRQFYAASRMVFATPELARRIQRRSRAILLLVFVLPGFVTWFWVAKRVSGRRAAIVLVLLLGLSFSILPYLSLVHTDAAEALGFAVVLLGALLLLERPGPGPATVAGFGLGLALASKYSGLLLVPPLALAAALAPTTGSGRWIRKIAALAWSLLLGSTIVISVYAIANMNYDPKAAALTLKSYAENHGSLIVDQTMLGDEPLFLRLEKSFPLIAQWFTGLTGIRRQNEIGVYPSFALGGITSQGRWWYFPILILAKVPLLILACLFAFGVTLIPTIRRRAEHRPLSRSHILVVFTAAIYFFFAMGSNYNIGFRHLLPILPILYLPAAIWLADRPRLTALVVALLVVEAIALAPNWMSATNTWWMGHYNPTRFAFGGSDGDWEQGLVSLANVATKKGITRLHIVSPLATPEEVHVWLDDAVVSVPGTTTIEAGWYAVSIILEQDLPAIAISSPKTLHSWDRYQQIRNAWQPLVDLIRRGEDHGYVAGVFHLYRLESSCPGPAK